jgi:hypothetical protein
VAALIRFARRYETTKELKLLPPNVAVLALPHISKSEAKREISFERAARKVRMLPTTAMYFFFRPLWVP